MRPGNQLITTVVALRGKGPFGKAQVTATVDGMVVAEGIVTYELVTVDGQRPPIGSLLFDPLEDCCSVLHLWGIIAPIER